MSIGVIIGKKIVLKKCFSRGCKLTAEVALSSIAAIGHAGCPLSLGPESCNKLCNGVTYGGEILRAMAVAPSN